ncbi:MAG: hypothetical protein WBL42_08775 [Methanoregula sp.]
MAMERNTLLLLLLITGCIVCLVGFVLAQFFPALFIVTLIVITFLYLDFQESHKSSRKDLKRNAAVAVFVIVTFYCMITGWWIFWAGITAMLYIDALIESIRDWLDARQLLYLEAMKTTKSPETLQQSILHLEQRVNTLEREKQ